MIQYIKNVYDNIRDKGIYNYESNFIRAKRNHAYFHLERSDFQIDKKSEYLNESTKDFIAGIVQFSNKNDLRGNCIHVSEEFHRLLWQSFGVPSILTFGYIITEGKNLFYKEKDLIREDLKQRIISGKYDKPAMIHAWLTLPDLTIIDPTIETTYANNNEIVILDGSKQKKGDRHCYIPLYLNSEMMQASSLK
jgi:hypothetical protein